MSKPKILLLSAYDAQSHRHWRKMLVAHLPEYEWTVLALPPRHFSWRVRGNALTWFVTENDTLDCAYDLIVATSMVDLAGLKGLYPKLSGVPTLLYFHENQFGYPINANQHGLLDAQITSIISACAASALVFNSTYNLQCFLSGVSGLLKKLPDKALGALATKLEENCRVIPVPIAGPQNHCVKQRETEQFGVVWNHRWEYDKGPETLLAIVEAIPADLTITFHIVGQQFRQQPPEFAQLETMLTARGQLGCFGYVKDQESYFQILAESAVVLSTALHDFQGLAILEAVSAGCLPVLPGSVVYPHIFAAEFLYAKGDPFAAVSLIQCHYAAWQAGRLPKAPSVDAFYVDRLVPQYKGLIDELLCR